MAKSSAEPGWWRRGRLWARFVWLGVGLGFVAAIVHLLSTTLPTFNPVFVPWYLFYLFFEVPFMAILGALVAGAVMAARSGMAKEATRRAQAILSGVVAFGVSGVSALGTANLTNSGNPLVVAVITGALVGGAFALVSYRHITEEAWEK